jgi:hypothetical protein
VKSFVIQLVKLVIYSLNSAKASNDHHRNLLLPFLPFIPLTPLLPLVFLPRQEPFICEQCGANVELLQKGSYRNHCPHCLWSKHVDLEGPGDRQSTCGGLMRPVHLDQRSGKGWIIVHECTLCKKRIPNIAAPDDDLQRFAEEQANTL